MIIIDNCINLNFVSITLFMVHAEVMRRLNLCIAMCQCLEVLFFFKDAIIMRNPHLHASMMTKKKSALKNILCA